MTITIPTGSLITLLGNVTPFASPHEDMPDFNVVRIKWDGTVLTLAATDSSRFVRDTWAPKEFEGNDKTLFRLFGGADDYWCMFISLDDALELIKHFKLPGKEWNTPITLDHYNGELKVSRVGTLGHQDLTAVVLTHNVEFPNIERILDTPPAIGAVDVIGFSQSQMSAFCSVVADGPMVFTYCGVEKSARVAIGQWFRGTVRPVTAEPKADMEILVGAVTS